MSPFGLVKSEVFEGHPNEGVQKDVGLTSKRPALEFGMEPQRSRVDEAIQEECTEGGG